MKRIILITLLFTSGGALAWYIGTHVNYQPLVAVVSGDPVRNIGDSVDAFNGVTVYFNGPVSNVSGRNLSRDGYNIGLRYQCVEFVKRYYYEYLKHRMPDSYGHARDFFNDKLADGARNTRRGLDQFRNGSASSPQVHDLLVFDGHSLNPYGHVAIVCAVHADRITIIQQNPGPSAPSRIDIPLTRSGEKWTVAASDVLGWLRLPD